MNGSLSALAVGGALLAAVSGTAQAQGGMAGHGAAEVTLVRLAHEQGGGEPRGEGRMLDFNDVTSGMAVPYDLAFNGGCRVYRMRWYQTGRRYWLRRYEDCREG